jgi:hypothetical protein
MRGLLLVLVLLAGCTGLRTDAGTRYAGMVLNARTLGAEELERRMADDATLREFVGREGWPDFLYVAGPADVELIYRAASRIVHFRRPGPDVPSVASETSPIPTPVWNVLEADLRAGTSVPLPEEERAAVSCWTVPVATGECRTCCRTPVGCSTACTE